MNATVAAYALPLVLLLLCGTSITGAASEAGDFDKHIADWVFGNGSEFPGAQGRLESDTKIVHGGSCALHLSGEFSRGGKYVSAVRKVLPAKDVSAVTLWIRSQNIRAAVIRLIDGTGQCHQHVVPIAVDGVWQEIRVDTLASRTKWGGANDGTWHQPLTSLSILVEKAQLRRADDATGALHVDELVAVSAKP